MFKPHGLSGSDIRKYHAALRQSRTMRLHVRILNKNEEAIGSLTAPSQYVIDGEVTVETTRDQPSRSLNLTLMDPKRRIDLDPGHTATSRLWADNFIAVERSDYVDALGDFVDVPVFWGPLLSYERTGSEVQVNAVGKEVLALDPYFFYNGRTFRRGAKIVDVIENIMRDMGERRFALPTGVDKKLVEHLSVGRYDEAWKVVRKLAGNINRQVFYDGAGRLKVRRVPDDAVWKFEDGNEGTLLTELTYSIDFSDYKNTIIVVGPEPEGKASKKDSQDTPRIKAIAKAERRHPLSPLALSRNGEPRYAVERVERQHIKRKADAIEQAEDILDRRLQRVVDYSFEALPNPCLEENDRVSVLYGGEHAKTIRLRSFSIPLTPGGTMYVGDMRKRPVRRMHRRRRHKR